MKINTQLLLSQGLLVILSILIVFLNIVTFRNMESDANFINYAGKLRFLNYKMAHISHEMLMEEDNNSNKKNELSQTVGEYEGIIDRLIEGCPYIKLKKLENENTLAYILDLKEDWNTRYKLYYEEVMENNNIGVLEEINRLIPGYVEEINRMVSDYSEFAEGKVKKAILRNGLITIIVILVTGYSYISVKNKIRRPIDRLLKELEEMDLIDEELAEKISLSKKDELGTMSSYIEELIYDGLTRTYNRRTGLSKLSTIFENAREDLHFSLIFMDLNGLKDVNDNLGHEAGDELLQLTVNSVKETIREEDFIIRLGGDEFLIALKDVGEKAAETIWERILIKYEEINNTMGKLFLISVSHGIVEYKNNDPTLQELIKIADIKMYQEKKRIKTNDNYQVIRALKDKS